MRKKEPPVIVANANLTLETVAEVRQIAKEAGKAVKALRSREERDQARRLKKLEAQGIPVDDVNRKTRRSDQKAFAAMEYISNPGLTINVLLTYPGLNDIPKKTMERWASEGRWMEKRHELHLNWQNTARAILGSKIAEQRVRDLEIAEKIQEKAERSLDNDLLEFKSAEGAVQAISTMIKMKEELRTALGNEIFEKLDQATSQALPKDDRHGYTPDVIEEIARRVVEERRSKQLPPVTATVVDSEPVEPASSKDEL